MNMDHKEQKKNRNQVGKRAGRIGIIINLLLALGKLMVGILATSVSITADALNNLMDAASSIVTLIGFKLAEKPADEEHPFGHARSEYLAGLVVAIVILPSVCYLSHRIISGERNQRRKGKIPTKVGIFIRFP